MENGYAYWHEMYIMSEMVKETTFIGYNKPTMTKAKFEQLQKKMKQQKREYEQIYGKSLSEERRKMMAR